MLAELASEVCSVEINEDLARVAARRLAACAPRVQLRVGDGWSGWPEHAPYDRIIVSCATEEIPDALVEQLAVPGRLLLPLGPADGLQHLQLLRKCTAKIETETLEAVRFVPMKKPWS